MNNITKSLFVIIIVAAIHRTAEGFGENSPGTDGLASRDPIKISCVSHLAPALQEVIEQYSRRRPEITIQLLPGASQRAVEEFIQNRAAAVVTGCPLSFEEVIRCRVKHSKEPVGTPIAMDALVIVVHPRNPLPHLTLQQVESLLHFELQLWEELGIPGREIRRYDPDPESDIARTASRMLLERKGFPSRGTRTATPEDPIEQVSRDSFGLGLSTFSQSRGVKMAAIQKSPGESAVAPTSEAIQNGDYPFGFSVMLHTAGRPEGDLKQFLVFLLNSEGQAILRTGESALVPLPFIGGN